MVRYFMRIALFAGLVATSSMARADIYRCVAADGTTLYSDVPCASDAKAKANITEEVGACSTSQCEEQHRQQAEEARERLRSEKDELKDAAARRRQADMDYQRDRLLLLEEQRSRKALEDRLAAMAMADQAAQGTSTPYYDYPGYPLYPIVGAPCRPHCKPFPHRTPDVDKRRREPSVRLRVNP